MHGETIGWLGEEGEVVVPPSGNLPPRLEWISPERNPWGIRLLDLRPLTLGFSSHTKHAELAANATSWFGNPGDEFHNAGPGPLRRVAVPLRYRIDPILADGHLFTPSAMEDKWCILCRGHRLLFIRSWTRKVKAVAVLAREDGYVAVEHVDGWFVSPDEPLENALQILDFLLRSHAMNEAYPVPLPAGLEHKEVDAAIWSFSMYGRRALFAASAGAVPFAVSGRPLRSDSVLHIAVARGDADAVRRLLDEELPVALPSADGDLPMHWAMARPDTEMSNLLLSRGAHVDGRGAAGVTPLMLAVEHQSMLHVRHLLQHGADPNARDERGFTALHRAAEAGLLDLVRELLDHGAVPGLEAHGQTAAALGAARGHDGVVRLLAGK